jgi:membrane peptidoglycan carboxypeptidase
MYAPRRQPRWQRVARRILILALFTAGSGAGVAEAYIDAVPFPALQREPQASVLYFADGRTILARVGVTDRSDVPLTAVPEAVRLAVLTAEDRDFYTHRGVSARGLARAVVADARGGRQGASTITQQYVRNAYLTQDFSVQRKAHELALAVRLERQLTKDQILQRYLNSIYFGRGAYGIAAAAHAYFGITVDRLTAAQGAVLAATVKDPWRFDPANDAASAHDRWRWIIRSARDLRWIGGWIAYPKVLDAAPSVRGPDGPLVDQVERELGRHGITAQQLHTQGLTVITTLDATAQRAATAQVAATLAGQPSQLRAALVAQDPQTGGVRAYYGGNLGRGYFDYAAATHPAASTFKPIVLAAALADGIGYGSKWDGSSPRLFPGRLGVPLRNHADLQCRSCTLERAMVASLNTPFYAVTEQIGAEAVRRTALRLGVPAAYGGQPSMRDGKGDPMPGRTRADISIGRYPVSPADLATVFATFAGGGVRHDRYFVATARSADGRTLWRHTPRGTRAVDARIAADVSAVLSAAVRGDRIGPDRPAAGKTGTQQWGDSRDNQDAWMAGYTPDLAAAVWIGRVVPGPLRDAAGTPIEGRTLPARLWRDFLDAALAGAPPKPLPRPARVGRTDVGDAGRSHHNPDRTGGILPADAGYEPVVHTAHAGRRLALTFDDGPAADTPAVLDLLAKYHIKATFCVVGENVGWYPAVLRRIAAEGHALCNHSLHHDDLGVMSPAKARADLVATDTAIAQAVPGAAVPYYRAPYGNFGGTARIGAELGHTPLGWLVDPDDWLLPGAGVIEQRIRDQLTPRAVVLVHDGGGDRGQTVAALTSLIPKLLADGWSFDLPAVTQAPKPLPSLARPASPAVTPAPLQSTATPPAEPATTPPDEPGTTPPDKPGTTPPAGPATTPPGGPGTAPPGQSAAASPSGPSRRSTSSTNQSSSCRTTGVSPLRAASAPCTLKPS